MARDEPHRGRPPVGSGQSPAEGGVPHPAPTAGDETPDRGARFGRVPPLGFHRLIGVLLTIGGLWHVASPWLARYSDVRAAVISSIVSGVALAVVGIIFIAVRGSAWLCWVGGAIGVWVLFAPHVLGYADRGLAANEAVWGGLFTIVLVGISGIERWLGRVRPPVRPAGQW